MSQFDHEFSQAKRLHPASLIYRLISTLPSLILVSIPLLRSEEQIANWTILILSLFSGLFILPVILLAYYYFTYYITPTELVIHSGIISKKQRNIPLKRIQNISIKQNILHRLLGIVKVDAETAGDSSTEGSLEFISKKDAETLQELIKQYQANNIAPQQTDDEPLDAINDSSPNVSKDEETLFSMNLMDNIRYGALRFRPVTIIAIGWFYSFGQQFFAEELDTSSFFKEIFQIEPWTLVLYIFIFIVLIVFTSWILDILLTINTYHGFKLNAENKNLYTEYGLLNKQKSTIPLKKLQSLSIITNPIRKKFNFYSLNIQTAGLGVNKKRAEAAIPFAEKETLMEICQNILVFSFPDTFTPLSRKTIRRAFIRYNLALLPLYGASTYFALESMWFVMPFLIIPFLYYAALLRFQYRGYKISNGNILIKQGFWFQKLSVIPIKKIQTLHIRESFFQRKLGLASLYVDTASSVLGADFTIVDIDTKDAEMIFEDLLVQFNNSQ